MHSNAFYVIKIKKITVLGKLFPYTNYSLIYDKRQSRHGRNAQNPCDKQLTDPKTMKNNPYLLISNTTTVVRHPLVIYFVTRTLKFHL